MATVRDSKALFSKIDTVIMRIRRLEDAQKWYEENLGLEVGYRDAKERLVVFRVGGDTGLTVYEWKTGEGAAPSDAPGSFPIFYPHDLDEAHRRLSERGVRTGPIIGDGQGTRWFSFYDLDGNRLEACHYPVRSDG